MHKLETIKSKFIKELESYADRNSFTINDIENVRNLISSVNKICEYTDAEEGKEEYSGRMSHTYPMPAYTYDEYGMSNARRRDAMGRYSRRGYSRDDGMMAKLYECMEEAPEHKKTEIKRMIEKLEQM